MTPTMENFKQVFYLISILTPSLVLTVIFHQLHKHHSSCEIDADDVLSFLQCNIFPTFFFFDIALETQLKLSFHMSVSSIDILYCTSTQDL